MPYRAKRCWIRSATATTKPTTISAGSLIIGGAGTAGTGALSIATNSVFDYASSASQTLSGAITGSGSLTKSGNGTLTLTGATLSYVGQTTVLAGRLNLAGGRSAPLGTSSVKVNAGAILNFNNTVGQAVALGAGVLDLGAGASGSASLGFDIGSLAAFDRISSTSAALAANRVIINLTGLTGLTAGSYDLLTAASGLASAAMNSAPSPGASAAAAGSMRLWCARPARPRASTASH